MANNGERGGDRLMLSVNPGSNMALMQRERAWVEIDLMAVGHNVQQILSLLSEQTALMAVVKADAYGHGAVAIAQTVLRAGATWLAVATIPEGIELREAGITAPILVLGATHTAQQVQAIRHWQLQPTLCTLQQAEVFSEAIPPADRLPVHLKLDTGMSRLGMPSAEAAVFVHQVRQFPNLTIASIYSHLATADSRDLTGLHQQQQAYTRAIQTCGIDPNLDSHQRPLLHLANSAATLSDASSHYDLVRAGVMIYGVYPAKHLQSQIRLRPVLQVKARITQVKTIAPGTGVSYGHQFIADRPTQIAVVGIGYADGVPRRLSNQMTVLVRGRRIAQVGAITMDQLMLDSTGLPDLQTGEVVTLLGQDGHEQIQVDDWADLLGTISWEVLCGFKHRLPRVAVG